MASFNLLPWANGFGPTPGRLLIGNLRAPGDAGWSVAVALAEAHLEARASAEGEEEEHEEAYSNLRSDLRADLAAAAAAASSAGCMASVGVAIDDTGPLLGSLLITSVGGIGLVPPEPLLSSSAGCSAAELQAEEEALYIGLVPPEPLLSSSAGCSAAELQAEEEAL